MRTMFGYTWCNSLKKREHRRRVRWPTRRWQMENERITGNSDYLVSFNFETSRTASLRINTHGTSQTTAYYLLGRCRRWWCSSHVFAKSLTTGRNVRVGWHGRWFLFSPLRVRATRSVRRFIDGENSARSHKYTYRWYRADTGMGRKRCSRSV